MTKEENRFKQVKSFQNRLKRVTIRRGKKKQNWNSGLRKRFIFKNIGEMENLPGNFKNLENKGKDYNKKKYQTGRNYT